MTPDRRRWLALYVLCLATLMIVLDVSIVNVALPSIRESLGFSSTSLSWVVNAYLLTFGGLLLLGGRLGDLYGPRRWFLIGIGVFGVASLASGLSSSQEVLIAARAVQGAGGAVASAIGLSLVVGLFPDPGERARAMGIAGFVASGGGAIGVLLGGAITGVLNWHWVFLVNVPVAFAIILLARRFVPAGERAQGQRRLDVAGAAAVTAALVLAVDGVVNGSQAGWLSAQTLATLAGAAILAVVFVLIERRVAEPLVPLGMLRRRNIAAANAIGALWAAAMFAWFFITALYLQLVLGDQPLEIGLAFLPANVLMGALSIGVSGRLVMRYGIRAPLVAGLSLAAAGLVLLARAPGDPNLVVDVLPSMLLLGAGAGVAFNPVLLAAMSDAASDETGLASGIVNTSFQLGGALGLSILATIAATQSGALLGAGVPEPAALLGGYHLAFLAGGGFAALAAGLGAAFIRTRSVGQRLAAGELQLVIGDEPSEMAA